MTKEEAKQLYLSEKNAAFNNGQKEFMGIYEWLNRNGIYEFDEDAIPTFTLIYKSYGL